jgi:hypothetical protein
MKTLQDLTREEAIALLQKIIDAVQEACAKPEEPVASIQIFVGDQLVGLAQRLNWSKPEFPTDNDPPENRLTAQYIRFDKAKIAEVFSRGFVHQNAQRLPFQITVNNLVVGKVEVKNAWITECQTSYMAQDWILVDEMTLEAEEVIAPECRGFAIAYSAPKSQ